MWRVNGWVFTSRWKEKRVFPSVGASTAVKQVDATRGCFCHLSGFICACHLSRQWVQVFHLFLDSKASAAAVTHDTACTVIPDIFEAVLQTYETPHPFKTYFLVFYGNLIPPPLTINMCQSGIAGFPWAVFTYHIALRGCQTKQPRHHR